MQHDIQVHSGVLRASWWWEGDVRYFMLEHFATSGGTRGVLFAGSREGWFINQGSTRYVAFQEAVQFRYGLQASGLLLKLRVELQNRVAGERSEYLLQELETMRQLRRLRLVWFPPVLEWLAGRDPFELEGANA